MPGLDGTGPWGEGPMTGGACGYCNPTYAGYGTAYGPRFSRGRGFRRGFGRCFGRGRGYGWRWAVPPRWGRYGPGYVPYYAPHDAGPYGMSRDDEISMLKEEAEIIKADLDEINKRMEGLQSEPEPSQS